METVLFIGIGGFLGANARYLVSTWLAGVLQAHTYLATTAVNVTGSLLLGMFIAWANARADAFPQQIRLLVATGFFGAYTTFSTYALESVTLGLDGRWTDFVLNVIIGNALSLAAALIGVLLVQRALGG